MTIPPIQFGLFESVPGQFQTAVCDGLHRDFEFLFLNLVVDLSLPNQLRANVIHFER